ncbi:MAG: hypothetical protein HOU01_10980 [Streptomycetaceae bacterium]|nr:hypothetical protein [Streptomycetaceae bacterium]
MSIFADVTKLSEDDRQVVYGYPDGRGEPRTLVLDKVAGTVRPGPGLQRTVQYDEVARAVATAWADTGAAPQRLSVQA